MSVIDSIAACALSQCSIHDASFDPSIVPDAQDMTHRTHEDGVVDQGQTGTCWMQAGLSFLSSLAHRRGLTIRFSSTHLLSFDKIEKASAFFAQFRKLSLNPDAGDRSRRRWHLLESPITDGGTWAMFMHLIQTYGVVPHDTCLPMRQATQTGQLNQYINDFLRACALRLEDVKDEGAADSLVTEAIDVISRAIRRAYGPQTTECTLAKAVHGKDFSGKPLELLALLREEWPYRVLAHAPDRDDGLYIGPATNNHLDLAQDVFETVDMATLVEACVRQLSCGIPVWVTCDVRFDFSSVRGVAASGLHRTDALLGIPRRVHADALDEKRARMRGCRIAPVHAMLLTGVKLTEGKPLQWRIQNSWGAEKPAYGKGFLTADHAWFCEHVFQVAVDACFTPPVPDKDGMTLPPWDTFGTVA